MQGQQLGGTSEYNTGRHHPTATGDQNHYNSQTNNSINNANKANHRTSKSLSAVHQSHNDFEAVARISTDGHMLQGSLPSNKMSNVQMKRQSQDQISKDKIGTEEGGDNLALQNTVNGNQMISED